VLLFPFSRLGLLVRKWGAVVAKDLQVNKGISEAIAFVNQESNIVRAIPSKIKA